MLRFIHRLIRTLVIPNNADPSVGPAIVIGPDIPADLQAFYTGLGNPVVSAIIFRYSAILYSYEAILSSSERATGSSNSGVILEQWIYSQTGSQAVLLVSFNSASQVAFGSKSTVPGLVVGSVTRTASVGTFTAETVVDSITIPNLVSGQTYNIWWDGNIFSSAADGTVRGRIREDNLAGTQLQLRQLFTATVLNQAFPLMMHARYTAVASGSKTFVATAVRQSGTGNITAQAATDTPTFMWVDKIVP